MKTLFLSLSLLLIVACGTKKNQESGSNTSTTGTTNSTSQNAQIGYSKLLQDSMQTFTITAAKIEGNQLKLSVEYSGGCEDHRFSLEGSENISKSLPPIRSIRLVSTGKQDNCRALIVKELSFDVSNLAYKQEDGSEIKLALEGWKEQLSYIFKTK